MLTLARSIQRESPIYEFSWWSVASATAWIPAAVTTIIAVPLIGCASAAMITAAVGACSMYLGSLHTLDSQIPLTHQNRPHVVCLEHSQSTDSLRLVPSNLVCRFVSVLFCILALIRREDENTHIWEPPSSACSVVSVWLCCGHARPDLHERVVSKPSPTRGE